MRRPKQKTLAYVVLPLAVLVMALGVGYLKWHAQPGALSEVGAAQVVSEATEATTAMLSYRAEYVDADLTAASEHLTGDFRSRFAALINDVVIPGAKEQRISAEATVPAAAVVSSTPDRAELLIYIDQTTTVGDSAPTVTQSSARVLVEKVDGRWLIADFEPI